MALLTAFAVLCFVRWQVWFGNPPEKPYITEDIPHRVLLTFSDTEGKDRNVSWCCGEVFGESFMELVDETDTTRVDAQGEVFESRAGKAVYYVAKLKGLQDGKTYRYRVCTHGKYSEWYSFRIPDKEKKLSFLYVGDVQDTINGIANQLLKSAFLHHPDAEFLACGGDLTERPTDAYWAETFRGLDSIGQSMPILTITGNHDYLKAPIVRLERRFSLVHSYFLDSMVGENQVFTTKQKDVQFFLLDTNREFFHLYTQRKWLEIELRKSAAKWKIVVLHHPLYSIKSKNNNLIQRWMFDRLIRKYNVDLVLQGHEHAYARMTKHDEGGTFTTPVYTVSHLSPKNYRIEFDDRMDKFGSGSRYYQKVTVSDNKMTLSAYDALTHVLYDSLIIVKAEDKAVIRDLGQNIPEVIEFTPRTGNKKDAKFVRRIKKYKARRGLK